MNKTTDTMGDQIVDEALRQRVEHVLQTNRFAQQVGEIEDISSKVDAVMDFLWCARYLQYAAKLSDDSIGSTFSLLMHSFADVEKFVCNISVCEECATTESLSDRLPAIVEAANRVDPSSRSCTEPDIHCLQRFLANVGLDELEDVLATETLAWAWILLRNIRKDLGITE